jgi:hypothetical protein
LPIIARALIFILFLVPTIVNSKTISILPLGDSITQGGRTDRQEYTYRFWLFCILKSNKVNFDFIGSKTTGLHSSFEWPDCNGQEFDLDHEGRYGWKTGDVYKNLPNWIKDYETVADIALIHLGTNDADSNDYEEDIVNPLKGIIRLLREKNPKVVILVGHLNFNGRKYIKIRSLVEQTVSQISTKVSPVRTVHFYENWKENPNVDGTDTFDWAHPNPQGQLKMAKGWFRVMRPFL